MLNKVTHSVNTTTPETESTQDKLQQTQLREVAAAICINGINQAVMMVSPKDLGDFALGFALSEGLIDSPKEVLDTVITCHEQGWQIDIQVLARTQHQLKLRRRAMAGPSGCGLCGIDSIEQAMALSMSYTSHSFNELPAEDIILQAKDTLFNLQQEYAGIRGNHCAAYFDLSANAIAYREDVGRHSALDKLLGCLVKKNRDITAGFALLTSRCSHDLIAKAARLSLSTLVTLAQPTDLAVNSARKAGLALFCFQHDQLKRFA